MVAGDATGERARLGIAFNAPSRLIFEIKKRQAIALVVLVLFEHQRLRHPAGPCLIGNRDNSRWNPATFASAAPTGAARSLMKLATALVLATSLFAGTACGSEPNVGGTCTASGGCDEDLQCNTSVPGGYCTASCTTSGSTDECPEESICDTISGAALACVKICKASTDCRSDLDCNGVSGSSVKACKPKS